MNPAGARPVWADINLDAIAHNAGVMAKLAAPAALCAVVKADAYGHGAVAASRAALAGGASWLAVASTEEAEPLRQAGIATAILVLSEPPPAAMADVVALGLTPTVYSEQGVEAAAKAAAERRSRDPRYRLAVHLKVDTGMHRVGIAPEAAVGLALAIDHQDELSLEGIFTHLAVADEPADSANATQLDAFDRVVDALSGQGIRPSLVHACNSAATMAFPAARHDLVRCGITLYGVTPAAAPAAALNLRSCLDLRPALSLRARVGHLTSVETGGGVSYGHRHRCSGPTTVATVPIGYADGVRWGLGCGRGDVLIGGRRYPIAGRVTMDQLMVDLGDDHLVMVGDEVVLLGCQGAEMIGAWEWADRLGTIPYEILCGIGPRVRRVAVGV